MIPYGKQEVTQEDIDSVVEVLRSDFLTQGSQLPAFEELVRRYCNAQHAIAVNNATSALHLACLALGLGSGDRLWTVPNTFVATANCALYCGAMVDFVDIDPNTWNMSVTCLEEKLEKAKLANQLPKVIIPVHFAGQPTEQESIWSLAQEYGIKIIEDASHAIGASKNDERVGSCRWSNITVFSFHPVKIITTGEGGMALTNDQELADSMMQLRSHGITRDIYKFTQEPTGPWYYEQQMLGFNYRMSDIHAALGISQMARLNDYIERRNVLAGRYEVGLKNLPLQLPKAQLQNKSAFHLFVVRIKLGETKKTHKQVFNELRENGIGVNVHYMPVHLQPYYRKLGFVPGSYPESEAHGLSAISLPLFPAMTDKEQDHVVDSLYKILEC